MAEVKGKHELVRPAATPSLAADGIQDTLMNVNTTKITFFNLEEPQQGESPEKRRVVFSVTIPTPAFFEYMINMRKSVTEGRGMIEDGIAESTTKLRQLLDALKGTTDETSSKKPKKQKG